MALLNADLIQGSSLLQLGDSHGNAGIRREVTHA